jgi:hypothetical protein
MNTERAEMEEQLKKHCVAFLRTRGFKGRFPDLYRDIYGFVSLINFQFFRSGGSFCVVSLTRIRPEKMFTSGKKLNQRN